MKPPIASPFAAPRKKPPTLESALIGVRGTSALPSIYPITSTVSAITI
jgi:hypothetical protein